MTVLIPGVLGAEIYSPPEVRTLACSLAPVGVGSSRILIRGGGRAYTTGARFENLWSSNPYIRATKKNYKLPGSESAKNEWERDAPGPTVPVKPRHLPLSSPLLDYLSE